MLRAGWHTFTRRPLFFGGVSFLFFILYSVLSWVTDPENAADVLRIPLAVASFVVGVVVEMYLINLMLAAHDRVETVGLSDGTARLPFWQYAAVKILTAVIVIIGLVLLIVPGIIAMIALMFSNYLVVDKGLGFKEALKQSVHLTRGHRLQLFLLLVALVLMNVVGALLLFVGLLVSVPVSMLTMAHAYRTLEKSTTPVPAA